METLIITAVIIAVVVTLMAVSIAVVEFFDRLVDAAASKVIETSFDKHAEKAIAIANHK